ncbi:MAG: SpoIIIAH-like family protein [Bacteroides sp.]|nr:SpoIIIAH-like family protein [Bacteroides sp.]MCM1548575.1 SpoIIIAH-like family protein [Clostridium sp.]
MKKVVKKNQIIITALAVMIAVAGYLSFTSKEVSIIDENGNTIDVSASNEEIQETLQTDGNTDQTEALSTEEGADAPVIAGAEGNADDAEVSAPVNDAIGEAVLTNAETVNVTSDAIVNAKLNREQTRSKSQELLLQIVNNEGLDQASKQGAVDELVNMTAIMERESICEQQLMAKGFDQCVVLISEGCVDVTVNRTALTEVEKAQIEDIVTRKAECDVSEIVITTMEE